MRQTLLFNALESISLNSARKRGSMKIFEVGNCYYCNKEKENAEKPLAKYSQNQRLAIAVLGDNGRKTWNSSAVATNFFTLKSIVEKLFERLGLNFYEGKITEGASKDLYTAESISYTIRGGELFTMGKVLPKLVAAAEVKPVVDVYYLEMDVEKLFKLVSTVKVKAVELSKFQPVRRDFALLVSKDTTFASLREAASRAEKKLLKEVTIFDVYEGDKLPEGKKSYALNFVLEDVTKSLSDKDIERSMSNIKKALEAAGAEVRS